MKKSVLVLVILVLFLALITAGAAQAKRPLQSTIEYWFVGAPCGDECFITWEGTISGDINGNITWFAGSEPMKFTGQASHYDGSWEIWDSDGENKLLAGYGYGSTTVRHGKNSNWRTNDTVTYAGAGYEEWLGRNVHQSGTFIWAAPGVPLEGDGIFRAN